MPREKLQAFKTSGESATQSTKDADESELKSATSIRADVVEAELAVQMQKKRGFWKFTCRIGWCSHDCECRSPENDLLKRKVAVTERELQQVKKFGAIRSKMERRVNKVAKEIQRKYVQAIALDLVIVIDCTSSMAPWIEEAKAAIISVIDNIKTDHPRANVRVGFVVYRDFCDHDKRIQTKALTSDVASVQQFIASVEAFGGGDIPEDIPGGLEAALAMPFQAEAKRIVVVGDAPCHRFKFHLVDDDMTYRTQIDQSPDICSQMREMAARGIDFSFIEIKPRRTAKMVAILQEAFLGAESYDGFDRDFQKLPLSKAGDIARFASVIAATASSSISASKQRSVFVSSKNVVGGTWHKNKNRAPVNTALVAPPEVKTLNWSEVGSSPAIAAVRHSLHFRPGDPVDWKNLDLKHTQQDTIIRLSRSCFAKGAMRPAHALLDCNMEAHLVAKCYFGKAATVSSSTSKTSLENDVKMQMVAKRLDSEFSVSDNIDKGVDFIFTCWYEVKNPREAGLSSSMAMFTAEPYIEGEYKKYNNNNGWIRDDGLDFSETAQAFSHFTWQRTYGELMVVDLQGVGGIFTDPQIHSKSGKFGCGNLLEVGMTAFFATHECNAVCSALGLKPLQSGKTKTKTKTKTIKADAGMVEVSNKLMTCSCPLCGGITMVSRWNFVAAYREGREIYCELCFARCMRKILTKFQPCKQNFEYSPYWQTMKAMEPAGTCVACEAKH